MTFAFNQTVFGVQRDSFKLDLYPKASVMGTRVIYAEKKYGFSAGKSVLNAPITWRFVADNCLIYLTRPRHPRLRCYK